MNRVYKGLLLVIALLLMGTATVSAHEGRIILKGTNLACEGVSIWKNQRYQVTGRCSGLVYPYQERLDQYLMWIRNEQTGALERVDNVEVGYFEGQVDGPFTEIFITAEGQYWPNQPSQNVLISGNLNKFNFSTNDSVSGPAINPTPRIATPTPTSAPRVNPEVTQKLGSGLKNAFIAIVAIAIGLGIALLIIRFISSRAEKGQ